MGQSGPDFVQSEPREHALIRYRITESNETLKNTLFVTLRSLDDVIVEF